MTFKSNLVASVKVDGKIMREHGDKIYLPFGSEYSILLKNLNTVKAQVNIKIDGEDILDGNSLIINAQEDLDLSRWLVGGLKTGPKLKFIEKTDTIRETKEETARDGIVEISYRFEKIYQASQWIYNTWNSPNYDVYYNSPFNLNYPTGVRGIDSSIGAVQNSTLDGALSSASFQPETFCASEVIDDCKMSKSSSQNEDGMTIKGEDVKQEFNYGVMGALDSEIHVICFQLKGDVNQEKVTTPITVKSKIRCDACYKMNNSNHKFCSSCGNNLKYSK